MNDPAQIPPHVQDFVRQRRKLTLATVDEAGHPHAADLWYAASEELRLWFISSPDSAHARHIARDPRVAITISATTSDPADIHGVQIHGDARMAVELADQEEARTHYLARFPFAAGATFRQRLLTDRFYRVTPTWIRWIDNRVRFGFKQEWTLPS